MHGLEGKRDGAVIFFKVWAFFQIIRIDQYWKVCSLHVSWSSDYMEHMRLSEHMYDLEVWGIYLAIKSSGRYTYFPGVAEYVFIWGIYWSLYMTTWNDTEKELRRRWWPKPVVGGRGQWGRSWKYAWRRTNKYNSIHTGNHLGRGLSGLCSSSD